MSWTAANGTVYTDEDLERWAAAQEDRAYEGAHLTPPKIGRPVSVGEDAQPFTIRLDLDRRAKVNRIAAQRQVTPSRLMRDLIDAL